MNEQVIDQVIAPVADEQVLSLTKLLKELDVVMIADIKSANQLNTTLANSRTFSDYSKNAATAALQLEKIQQAQLKTQASTVKLEEMQAKANAAQKARDEQAAQRLAQQQAKQAAADAKEIANAEAKAAKLAAIAEASARKRNVQFPESQTAFNPVTVDDGQSVSATEANNAFAASQTGMQVPITRTTEAIAAENAALLEQQEVLGSLTVAQRANIEALLALQAERAANLAEMKALNVEDAVGAERATFLTAENTRLAVSIREVNMELNKQTKEQLSQEGSVVQLTAALEILRNEYFALGVAERESAQGQKMLIEVNALDLEVKRLRMSVGDTSKEVGAYEKAIAKATSGTQLATQAITIATRTIVRMVVQFALFAVIFKAAEALYDYIRALDMFNPVADEATRKQQALVDAFTSSEYTKGIENVEKLAANLELAKKGITDSDNAINEYNETIGKTFGYVNNLNDAQKGFIDNSDAYINAIYIEAAAQSALAKSAKEIGEAMAKNQEDRNEIERMQAGGGTVLGVNLPKGSAPKDKASQDYIKNSVGALEYAIKARDKRIKDIISNSQKAVTNLYKDLDTTPGQTGVKPGDNPAADLRTKIANEALEQQKITAQNLINNDKLSYATRLKAAKDFYDASAQIEKNNEDNALAKLPAKDARKEDIIKDGQNKLLQLQINYNNQVQQLNDKAYKQDQDHLKANIQAQKDLFKQIADDPNQSYDMKLIALDQYNKKSLQLIKITHAEEVKEAGKNAKSITAANDNQAKAELQLTNEVAAEKLKIQKDNLQKILAQSQESEQDQLYTLDEGSKQALRALDKHKNDLLNAKAAEFEKGKTSEKEYNEDILLINDEYNVKRIQQAIVTQRTILAIKEGNRDSTLLRMRIDGATPEDIAKFTKTANKDIQGTVDTISGLTNDYDDANSKYNLDKNKGKGGKDPKNAEIFAIEQTGKALDELDKLRQKSYEAEIARLEKLGGQIDANAQNEKDAVNNSIASNATKAREISVIEAQTAAQKQALQEQENKAKHKADVADKEAAIAKIILETAIAAIKAPAELGPILGLAAVPVVLALGAVELALAVATPLPKYAKGTKNYPGGLGIWGEAGIERALLPDGSVEYSPNRASLANFPKGTVITPHTDLMRQIKPEPVKFVGAEQIPWHELINAVKDSKSDKRSRIIVNVDNGFEQYQRNYLNR